MTAKPFDGPVPVTPGVDLDPEPLTTYLRQVAPHLGDHIRLFSTGQTDDSRSRGLDSAVHTLLEASGRELGL
jgi:hypothetical protein